MVDPHPPASDPPEEERPDVPVFRSWRGVYCFVFAFFVGVVIALTIFSRAFA